jgi:alpha-galactosidase
MEKNWTAPAITGAIPHGDMPEDKVCIGEEHIRKAKVIFPELRRLLEDRGDRRTVVAVCGGSGVGKSEIASVLAYYLKDAGFGAYVLSGDNYPRRIPRDNDLERLRIYRTGGLRALVKAEMVSDGLTREIRKRWETETDADPEIPAEENWYRIYREAGRAALSGYLGTPAETDFDEVNGILAAFHEGAPEGFLKRMGRETTELWYDRVDWTGIRVLIVEWTHGNSEFLKGVDIPILLHSTPAETLAHRRARNRDGKTDSAFTTLVLEIEQEKLHAQASRAAIILSRQGELLSYEAYSRRMENV